MTHDNEPKAVHSFLSALNERAKELTCLYRVEELLSESDRSLEQIFTGIVKAIPPAWQYPEQCQVKIVYESEVFTSPNYRETQWMYCAVISVQDVIIGRICLSYKEEMPPADHGPFLNEEIKLIDTVAERIGHFVLYRRLRDMFEEVRKARVSGSKSHQPEWAIAMDLLKKTDVELLGRITRKMINYLGWRGIREARSLLERHGDDMDQADSTGQENVPQAKTPRKNVIELSDITFEVAVANMSDDEIMARIQKWIHEDRSGFLVDAVLSGHTSLQTVVEAVRRYQHNIPGGIRLSDAAVSGLRVALIRRFFTEQLEYINVAKRFLDIQDFFELMGHVIFPSGSHGKLGGKSAGMFLANKMIQRARENEPDMGTVKIPKTWYVASDGIIAFVQHNNLGEVYEQKYKSIDEVRQEYPHIVQVFKHSSFPPEIVHGLSVALDDLGNVPLVVRSSSLLEDRLGTAFSGKYKSLFIANQGTKEQRLEALMDAIAEVYASTFGPDPIEYRAERGLLDFNEEMGIMIQEVVGVKVGHYYMPCFAGVAFSRNEFRWSPRIKREDGLVRMVPGLGTRAVDRLSDDYPILVAPGQPRLRVNVSIDEVVRYSPQKIDVINLKKNRFETRSVGALMEEYAENFPRFKDIVSLYQDGFLRKPMTLNVKGIDRRDVVITFDELLSRSCFMSQISTILRILEQSLGTPVDIEFASDGEHFYLLQCRPQAQSRDEEAVKIPAHLPEDIVVFSANRFVSNGRVPDITHIVYVDPEAYRTCSTREEMIGIGETVGQLNKILPKRQFILMGPGRWGSRGDIKLGVPVTYADINNTAMLIEVARRKGNYVPEVSFGTHFFQDLVEASIRYLPLFPDDEDIIFDETFLAGSENMLSKMLPGRADYSTAIRVIDIPKVTDGKILRVLLNAEQDKAVAFLAERELPVITMTKDYPIDAYQSTDEASSWRLGMAKRLAERLDPECFGVHALYIFGSTKNATAGPESDIDLLIHFRGEETQRNDLEIWLNGWSQALSAMNYLRTGHRTDGLLDAHIITDRDIENRSSYAVKIGAVTDAARRLPLKGEARV